MDRYANAYRAVQARTAGPGELLLMLLDRTALEVRHARELLQSRRPGVEVHLLKAHLGIVELDRTLNFEAGPELAASLHNLYLHLLWRLSEALESHDPEPLVAAEGLLGALRETWREAFAAAAREAS